MWGCYFFLLMTSTILESTSALQDFLHPSKVVKNLNNVGYFVAKNTAITILGISDILLRKEFHHVYACFDVDQKTKKLKVMCKFYNKNRTYIFWTISDPNMKCPDKVAADLHSVWFKNHDWVTVKVYLDEWKKFDELTASVVEHVHKRYYTKANNTNGIFMSTSDPGTKQPNGKYGTLWYATENNFFLRRSEKTVAGFAYTIR